MTYFKCASCKTRLYGDEGSGDMSHQPCPDCGAMLQPVGKLAELVGYRSIDAPGDPELDDMPRAGGSSVTYRFGELLANRRAQAELDDADAAEAAAAFVSLSLDNPDRDRP